MPEAIYYIIVTVSTVGYGDIHPQSVAGQAVASCAMVAGYSIIAVPAILSLPGLLPGLSGLGESPLDSLPPRGGAEYSAPRRGGRGAPPGSGGTGACSSEVP